MLRCLHGLPRYGSGPWLSAASRLIVGVPPPPKYSGRAGPLCLRLVGRARTRARPLCRFVLEVWGPLRANPAYRREAERRPRRSRFSEDACILSVPLRCTRPVLPGRPRVRPPLSTPCRRLSLPCRAARLAVLIYQQGSKEGLPALLDN